MENTLQAIIVVKTSQDKGRPRLIVKAFLFSSNIFLDVFAASQPMRLGGNLCTSPQEPHHQMLNAAGQNSSWSSHPEIFQKALLNDKIKFLNILISS